ncbi:MAG: peptidoglycan bridge formation glycyltransferase FemA/FemB family protein [Candidatus Komeilibacteria bacterium]|nr:peptidoglycan bridge formation glycyltransferase FemA/FemB family protein [Candidatus Komeilibacteria bacterium]
MTYRLETNLNPLAWDKFLIEQPFAQVLQSATWQTIQEQENHKVWPIAVLKDGQTILQALVIKHNLPLGFSYLYCPHGPVLNTNLDHAELTEGWKYFLSSIREVCSTTAQQELFLKIEPTLPLPVALHQELPFKPTASVQPRHTTYLDLSKDLSDLENNFHQKTRYNIKVAQKHEVKIRRGTQADLLSFWKLLQQTSKRDAFQAHGLDHYEHMIEDGSETFQLWLAENQGQVIAANLYSFFGDTVTYLHGASDHAHRAIMAPYLLHWQLIEQAKIQGCHYYDFYGIAPLDENGNFDIKHPWAGFTKFKLSWGGQHLAWPPCLDLVYQPPYYTAYKIFKKLRRIV